MTLQDIAERLRSLPFFADLRSTVGDLEDGESLRLKGVVGSLPAFALADLATTHDQIVALTAESESADYLRSDLEQLLGGEGRVLLLPPTGKTPYDDDKLTDSLPLVQRADALGQLRTGFKGVLVTSVEALFERVPPPSTVKEETMSINVGDDAPPKELIERLTAQGFSLVEFVSEPGEIALRGGILDVYPFAGGYPVRLEFFGDEVDQIREFDPQSQRSVARLETARLVP
ncbi:MAG: transcription-repair coupling factor, partial [Rubrivirga sp.]